MMNKTCAIVGTGRTMGRAIAKAFAEESYDLALLSRSRDNLERIREELRPEGSTFRTFTVEVTDADSVTRAFDAVEREMGVPDVLIYNVAVLVKTPPSELTVRELLETLPQNLFGAMECVRRVLPSMRKRKSGTIIFTGGGFGIVPSTLSASHSIGKAALRNYARNLHQELADEGIHAAMVTITRPVVPKSEYDPDEIARHYVDLCKQPRGTWEWEIVHREL